MTIKEISFFVDDNSKECDWCVAIIRFNGTDKEITSIPQRLPKGAENEATIATAKEHINFCLDYLKGNPTLDVERYRVINTPGGSIPKDAIDQEIIDVRNRISYE